MNSTQDSNLDAAATKRKYLVSVTFLMDDISAFLRVFIFSINSAQKDLLSAMLLD